MSVRVRGEGMVNRSSNEKHGMEWKGKEEVSKF